MRVRQMAVVGAIMAVAWAGGAGIAQATPSTTVEHRAVAQVGCLEDEAALAVSVTGLPGGESARLVVDGVAAGFLPINVDGSANLFAPVDPDATVVDYTVELRSGAVVVDDSETVEDTCSGEAALTVTRDCTGTGSLTLALAVRGLEPDTDYYALYWSDGFTLNPGYSGNAGFVADFTTDGTGAAQVTILTSDDEATAVSAGAIDIESVVYGLDDLTSSVYSVTHVDACPAPGGTQPGGTTPGGTTPTTPAPTTPAPVTAAPVVVTHPAAAQPAVLANTGTPTASIALLGGGLLVVGAGAMVATRRRAN